ncbi:MAG: S41 family peptidase, partial [Bacteroidota bacterium]
MKKTLLSYFLFISCLLPVEAQQPSKKMVKEMVQKIEELILTHYVLPEQGEKIAAQFRADFQKGRFDQANSLKQLDSTMTKSLREVSQDFHLYVWNNKEIVEQLKAEARAEPDEEEAQETSNFFNSEKAYQANFGFEKVEVLEGNIGYIKLSQINISKYSLKKLYAAMHLVANTQALILDLRNNGGGGSSMGAVLESFFFEEYTELLEFRQRNGSTNVEATVPWLLEKRYPRPLYILINKRTGSAAEAFTFALKNQKRCILVGTNSS